MTTSALSLADILVNRILWKIQRLKARLELDGWKQAKMEVKKVLMETRDHQAQEEETSLPKAYWWCLKVVSPESTRLTQNLIK